MSLKVTRRSGLLLAAVALSTIAGCKGNSPSDAKSEAPPAATVQPDQDSSLVQVKDTTGFPLAAASAYTATSSITATGSVQPDTSSTIPVISIASGRVVALHARLGDYVKKGQLLMEVQSTDVSGAFGNYLKAQADEKLAQAQLDRAKILYDKGAIPQSQLEIAQNALDDARSARVATEQQLRVLGVDKDHPGETVKITSPASGYIIAQNVTEAAAAGMTYAGSSSAFTIADLSHVWIVCDVYENDLPQVHVGNKADIRLTAYPDRTLTGTVSDVGAVLDPTLRSGKVRLQVANPNMLMRVGMFATATFHGKALEQHAQVPAAAILHLHDRDWIYEPAGDKQFRRVAVQAGAMLPNAMQEIVSGIPVGQQVVSNALTLQNAVSQ